VFLWVDVPFHRTLDMRKTITAITAAVLLGTASIASADQLAGRLRSIDPATNSITLDSGQTFQLATPGEAAMLVIGEKVTVTFSKSGTEKVASAVDPAS
jgi:fructose-1,6-bisphosphatase/sedoheptulose 1,7-bisphosphatase-like protein